MNAKVANLALNLESAPATVFSSRPKKPSAVGCSKHSTQPAESIHPTSIQALSNGIDFGFGFGFGFGLELGSEGRL